MINLVKRGYRAITGVAKEKIINLNNKYRLVEIVINDDVVNNR